MVDCRSQVVFTSLLLVITQTHLVLCVFILHLVVFLCSVALSSVPVANARILQFDRRDETMFSNLYAKQREEETGMIHSLRQGAI